MVPDFARVSEDNPAKYSALLVINPHIAALQDVFIGVIAGEHALLPFIRGRPLTSRAQKRRTEKHENTFSHGRVALQRCGG
jgi:hypothetical protein